MEGEGRIRIKTLLLWLLVIGLAGLWLVWWQSDALIGSICGVERAEAADELPALSGSPELAGQDPADELTAIRLAWTDLLGDAPRWPEDFSAPADCAQVEQDLLALCRELDSRSYVRSRVSGGGFCSLVRAASAELATNPPVLAGESRDCLALLSNAFHLFRTLGRTRLALFAEVVREEDDLAEPFALALYRWLISRQHCAAEGGGSAVDLASLYRYAGFLLETIGGQAYLRRRSPGVEALASFYAVLIIDQADLLRLNSEGIDLRPQIERTRQLLRTRPLLFAERYLELLDEISMRWDKRGSG